MVDVWEYAGRHRVVSVDGLHVPGCVMRVVSSVVVHGRSYRAEPGRTGLLTRAYRAVMPSAGHRWDAVGVEVLYGDRRLHEAAWTLWRCARCESEVLSHSWPWRGRAPCDEELARSVLES